MPLGTLMLNQGMVQYCVRVARLMGASGVLQVEEHIWNVYTWAHAAWGPSGDELESLILSQSYDTAGTIETWWGESYIWSVGMEGCWLFRRDWQGSQGGGMVLRIRETLTCTAFVIGAESLWVRMKGTDSSADVVGVYYTPHTQDSGMSYRQLRKIVGLVTFVLMGNFEFWDIIGNIILPQVWEMAKPCWK